MTAGKPHSVRPTPFDGGRGGTYEVTLKPTAARVVTVTLDEGATWTDYITAINHAHGDPPGTWLVSRHRRLESS